MPKWLLICNALGILACFWGLDFQLTHSQQEVATLSRALAVSSATVQTYKQELGKRDKLLGELFGKVPSKDWITAGATITWYSLSVDECDEDPDTAAHGPSRPFMSAISKRLIEALFLEPGDRIAVISDDGEIGAVVTYWDRKHARYDDGNWIDIVAPSKKVAQRWSIRPGRIVKI